MNRFGSLSLLVLGLGIAAGAQAQDAWSARPLRVHAGPDRDYPLVAQIGPGQPLEVNGCLSDWSWCDVSFDDTRGWVYSTGLQYAYQGDRVPLYTYAPSLGIPVVTFTLGSYWDHYYRGRPFYGERHRWEHRRMPEHMHPAYAPRQGPPPHGRGGEGMQVGGPSPHGHMPGERSAPQGRSVHPVERGPQERGGSAAPERGAPERGAPEHGAPERGAPERAAPAHAAPAHAASERAPLERAAPERGASGRAAPEHGASGHAAPEHHASGRAEPERGNGREGEHHDEGR